VLKSQQLYDPIFLPRRGGYHGWWASGEKMAVRHGIEDYVTGHHQRGRYLLTAVHRGILAYIPVKVSRSPLLFGQNAFLGKPVA